ncbi:MAG: peptidoglycan-binding protein, partial [Betaproteobacteria bacterium]|nr:peptidoglycan-binding protein [Betaproteobacteria bacterium]
MFVRQLAAIIAASLMAGCSLVQPVQLRDQAGYFEKAGVENRPVLAPVRSVSSFNDALSCMDRQLAAANLGTVYITSKTLQDPTGKLQIDLKDMVITSLLRMSRVSNTFRVVDYEVDAVRQDTVQVLTSLLLPTGQMEVRRPQIYISGGVAYSDTNVISKRHNVGLSAVSSAADAGSNTAQGS